MTKHPSFWSLTLLLVLSAACGDSTGPDSIAGRYVLKSIDGSPLPVVIFQMFSDKVEVTSGYLQINADGTCRSSLSRTLTEENRVTNETDGDMCTWTQDGSEVVFSYPDGATDTGSLTGNVLAIRDGGLAFVFAR